MVIILTKSADGDDGAAVFNSAFGNMLGVFLSPLLILGYLGVTGDVDLGEIFYKLVLRVVVPLAVGQVLQKFSKTVADFVQKYKAALSKSQMYALIFIVYTVFCETFSTGTTVSAAEFVLVLLLQAILLISFMIAAWFGLKLVFPKEPRLRVTGVYGCTFKTVSLGVPLINAMYEGSPNVAMYILPLLMWYPMQLAIGSIMAPRLYKFVQQQVEELSCAGVIVDEGDAPTDDGGDDAASVDSKQFSSNNHLRTGKVSPTCVVDVESPAVGVDARQNNK
jgi:solute carrier family 10 (sodium/bile acid cotransporter), member 7